ncbi:MAG: carboxymuconolactone decarboxylase family protein [Rhodanobacter sp.]
MSNRLNYLKHPNATQALSALNTYVRQCGLEQSLIELIFLRVSQLNGCAYCLDMHTKDARAAGETEQRLYLLQAWWVAPFYSERERAALAWCEAVTHLGPHGVADDVYEQALRQFSEAELMNLNMAVILMNGWNRIAIPFKAVPGSYKPAAH